MKYLLYISAVLGFVVLISCKKDPQVTSEKKFTTTPYLFAGSLDIYELADSNAFPRPNIPRDNPLTVEGVKLGRMLFYDKRLSGDESISCAHCHHQVLSFTDGAPLSEGINGRATDRNSMAIINMAWNNSFFWDGRRPTLELQALDPVPHPAEMFENWFDVVDRLKRDTAYPRLFREAFGTEKITPLQVTKAIAQFERTLVSTNSKFDRFRKGQENLTPQEHRGFVIFNTEKGDCFHCHESARRQFAIPEFKNNGLDANPKDIGRAAATGREEDIGKFKIPTLRNIEYTRPYMHDGRFNTLEEVVDFYSEGVKANSPNIDPLMKKAHQGGIQLTASEKEDLIAFLRTLSDTSFVNNPAFSDPFE